MNEDLPLSGLHVLVVEDVLLVAMELSDQLTDLGCEVIGPASSVKQAMEQIDGVELHGAVLDVNLGDERSFPIAALLTARDIPFLFLTGYDSPAAMPDEFQKAPRLSKPVDAKALTNAVSRFHRKAS